MVVVVPPATILVFTACLMLSDYIRGSIRKDEQIIFFPTIARRVTAELPSLPVFGMGAASETHTFSSRAGEEGVVEEGVNGGEDYFMTDATTTGAVSAATSSVNSLSSMAAAPAPPPPPSIVWEIPIHGWVFQPNRREKRRKLFLTLLRRSLKLRPPDDIQKYDVLKRRMAPFLVDNSRNKLVRVQLLTTGTNATVGATGDATGGGYDHESAPIYTMPRSRKNGHFYGVIRVNETSLGNMDVAADDGVMKPTTRLLPFRAVLNEKKNDTRIFGSQAHLVPSGSGINSSGNTSVTGISVISDIDDTVKITNVTSKKNLLRNTFLEEFKPVPGMAALYRRWQHEFLSYDVAFHFVSSSPWQLYEELEAFRKAQDFPDATFHLKSIRVKDRSLFQLFANPFTTKQKVISSILDQFPDRQFICVGDSGEKDPEVYGALARQYPNQIAYILIRDIGSPSSTPTVSMNPNCNVDEDEEAVEVNGGFTTTGSEESTDRMERAFARVPPEKWAIFTDASEIVDVPDLMMKNKDAMAMATILE